MLRLVNNIHIDYIIFVLFCVLITRGAHGEEPPLYVRIPLNASSISFELGDTSRDYLNYDKDGKEVYVDSEASYTFDEGEGSYSFKFKDPYGKEEHTAFWIPCRYLKASASALVTQKEKGGVYRYEYAVEVSENSKQSLERFTILPGMSAKIGATSDSVRPYIAESIGKSKTSFSWWLKSKNNDQPAIRPGGTLSGLWIEAEVAPTVVPCIATGKAPIFRTTTELPPSIETALDPFKGPNEDCVKGFTVGPGKAKPTLERIREHLTVCLEQGWIAQGESYALLDNLLRTAEEASKARPDDMPVILEGLLRSVKSAMETHQSSMAPEVDALIRMNIQAMVIFVTAAAPKGTVFGTNQR